MARKMLTPIDMSKLEILNQRVHFLASAPGSPVEGQIYMDSVTHKLYFYNGTTWIDTEGAVSYATTTELADVDGAAEGAGSSSTVARGDHKHLLSLGTVTAQTSFGLSSANGTANSASRSDHVHGTPSVTYAGTSDLADVDAAAEAAGSATTFARGDHKHALSVGSVTAQTSFGLSSANGSANSASRSDHVHGTPVHDDAAHNTVELNDLAAPDGDVAFGGFKITGLGTPTSGTDGATKAYVDAAAAGIDWKASVRVATTGNGTLATAYENGDTVDGIALATGNRILIKDQSTGAENGIYTVNASGAPTRATDADVSAEMSAGTAVFVEEGTVNADTGWIMTNDGAITLGTTALVFAQFTALGSVTAGTGLTKTGSTINAIAGTGMVANADDLAVLRTDANGRVPLRYAVDVGDNSSTSITVTHNLNTKDVIVQVYDLGSPYAQVECDVEHATVNTVTLKFAVAPTTAQYRCVALG